MEKRYTLRLGGGVTPALFQSICVKEIAYAPFDVKLQQGGGWRGKEGERKGDQTLQRDLAAIICHSVDH